jgi:hypothetical protein
VAAGWKGAALFLTGVLLLAATSSCPAGNLDTIGVTRLLASFPTLIGTGIPLGQPEAQATGSNDWELYPPNEGQPLSFATWINTNGSATNFPNALGFYSGHGDEVGANFYGITTGVAPGAQHVNNYEADYFFAYIVQSNQPVADKVVNQSSTFGALPASTQQQVDSIYDNYIATHGNLFCSSVNDGGQVCAPGTSYNGLGVGAYGIGAATSIGPTVDNGRSKPDLVAPAGYTSFSTPYVSGAGAVLLQAAARGDGGTNLSAAGDVRTLRALLLNGAVKPGDWTHTPPAPLDTRYGAGVLNLFYSYQQLAAGQQPLSASQTVFSGAAHPPGTPSNLIPSLLGWDFQTITSNPLEDSVNHYYFNNSGATNGAFTLTATLEWDRPDGESGINQLALFLYNSANGNLVTNSVSTVDNEQHIYVPSLARGQYDLQVIKYGSASQSVALSETYALAFQFYPVSSPALNLSLSGANVVVSWPSSPTIFNLRETTSLKAPISWTAVSTVGLLTGTNVAVTLSPAAGASFYQLSR